MLGRSSIHFVEISLGDPPSDSFKPCWLVKKHGQQGGPGLFCLIWLQWKLKISSFPKVSGRSSIHFVEMFLRSPSIRFLQAMLIGQKTWPTGGGLFGDLIFCLMAVEWYWPSWASCWSIFPFYSFDGFCQSLLIENEPCTILHFHFTDGMGCLCYKQLLKTIGLWWQLSFPNLYYRLFWKHFDKTK